MKPCLECGDKGVYYKDTKVGNGYEAIKTYCSCSIGVEKKNAQLQRQV